MVDDMAGLPTLDEVTLLEGIRNRYKQDVIYVSILLNPLNPHDALKHHFSYLKTDLIFLQPRVLERKFP